MKKIKVLLSALAMVAALAFVSCGGGAGDDPKGGESGSGATKPEDLVIFDYDGVDDDIFVFDITASYDNYYNFEEPIPEGSGYKKIHVIGKYESTDGVKGALQLMTKDNSAQASATLELDKDYSEKIVDCLAGATYEAWENNASVTKNCADTAAKVQAYIQNKSWGTTTGTIYIKKVWLSAE